MNPSKQCYYGDWVSYQDFKDAGYYLGAKFIQFLTQDKPFHSILSLSLEEIKMYYQLFLRTENK